jgi:hypothetical protein
MTTYISSALRQLVATRAQHLCEYCLIHEDDAYFGCEVDHIISEKHGGQTEAEILAFACAFCNRSKASDLGSLIGATGVFARFFQSTHRSLERTFCPKIFGVRVTGCWACLGGSYEAVPG